MKSILSLFWLVAFSLILSVPTSPANAEEDLGLCPDNFSQRLVTTTLVECFEQTRNRSDREEAERERIEAEALCLFTPNASIASSDIFSTSSGGAFFAQIVCEVSRPVPPGTTLCPEGSEELLRAFDSVFCGYFGTPAPDMAGAQAQLAEQTTACTAASGRSLRSEIMMDELDDETPFFFAETSCVLSTAAVDVFECPPDFRELRRDTDSISCLFDESGFNSMGEAQATVDAAAAICETTTAGLGTVSDQIARETSNNEFVAIVECDILIPRFGDFADGDVVRACDASCTLDLEQNRPCVNGGVIGGPGCTAEASQVITQRCNTGPDPAGLCPFPVTTTTVIPTLLLGDDEE